MTDLNPASELIITLSRDKVALQLTGMHDPTHTGWQATFPVDGCFIEGQIANVLDLALTENPILFEPIDKVDVLLVDSPALSLPVHYRNTDQVVSIASRYLRLRVGDTLMMDAALDDSLFVYTVPAEFLQVIREYYSNSDPVHLYTVLWNAIRQHETPRDPGKQKMFLCPVGHTLFVFGEKNGELTFSKSFYIHQDHDLLYYALACRKLLNPEESWCFTIRNEFISCRIPQPPHFSFHHQLELPGLSTLIAQYRLCES